MVFIQASVSVPLHRIEAKDLSLKPDGAWKGEDGVACRLTRSIENSARRGAWTREEKRKALAHFFLVQA